MQLTDVPKSSHLPKLAFNFYEMDLNFLQKCEALEALGFACLMTGVQALERTWDRLNLTKERMAKLSSSDVELDGMAEVGYYGIGPLSDVVQ